MLHPVQAASHCRTTLRRSLVVSAAFLALFLTSASRAQEEARKDGLFLSVPNPITSEGIEQLRNKIRDAVQRQKRDVKVIVFDFNPDDQPAETSVFARCLELADLIRKLQLGSEPQLPRVDTVAYVHKDVTKHTVLPVIACQQMVVSPDAALGGVPRGELNGAVRTAYDEQAKYHPTPALVQRVFDSDLQLVRVKTPEGEPIVPAATFESWKKQGKDVALSQRELRGLDPGRPLIDAQTLLDTGLAKASFDNRGTIAEALGLTRRSVTEDWLVSRTPVAWRIEVRGLIDAGKVQSIERRIKQAVGRNANLIILQLDSEAGDIRNVAALANEIRTLKDNTGAHPVRTIAWIPPKRALGAATFLAVGCSEIVMGSDSDLADFRYLSPADRQLAEEMLFPIVNQQGYPETVFRAAIEPNLSLIMAAKKGQRTGFAFPVLPAEYERDQKSLQPKWEAGGKLVHGRKNAVEKISPAIARTYQITSSPDVDTIEALYSSLGLEADKVRVSRDDFLDQVAEFFREPIVNVILVTIGIIGLILEMKLPGTTIPGTIAAICFVLFFWAYSFVGEFTMLAVFLFVLGLIMIAVEIFVIPGFTFVGLTGILLVIGSMALVTLDHWPTTSHEWASLGGTFGMFGVCMIGAVIGAIVLAYFLPSIPYANKMVLAPPSDEQAHGPPAVPSRLLGAVGVSVTTLRPAGKAQFGDDFLDVVAEGDYVEPGKRLQIIEIEGNRIVVKEV